MYISHKQTGRCRMKRTANPCKETFLENNRKNYIMSFVGKVLSVIMTISMSLIFTLFLEAVEYRSGEKLLQGVLVSGICTAANFFCSMFRRKYQNQYLRQALTQFKNYVFEGILGQSISRYSSGDTAKFISAFSNDLNAIEQHYLIGSLSLFVHSLGYVVTAAVMIALNWQLGLIVLVTSLIALGVSFRFGSRVVRQEERAAEKNAGFIEQTKDLLSGFVVIKSFKAENEIMGVFRQQNVDLESTKQSRRVANDTISIVANVSATVVTIIFLVAGFLMAFYGKISVGKVVGFFELSSNIVTPMHQLGPLTANRRAAEALIARIDREIREVQEPMVCGEVLKLAPENMILDHLTFGYQQDKPILRDVSQVFEAGKSYALVGASGSGKSTLLRLLQGRCSGYEGSLTCDGVPMERISLDSLYAYLSVIQQEVFLFNSSIENNITMFRPFEAEKLHSAMERAGLNRLVAEKGIDYLCGEDGRNLSGGEKQRVSIARCFIRDTPIVLVDEAEAALDNETAQAVLQTILDMQQTLRIVVTHRLTASIMEQYDEILVLHNGQIAERGTFAQLLEQKGYFYSLYKISQ